MRHKTCGLRPALRGQALIEVMVAVSILVVGFLGVVSLLSRALALNRVVADNYIGTYLAAEGIEIVKNVIDGNTLQGLQWNTENGVAGCPPTGAGCEVSHDSLSLEPFRDRPLFFDPSTSLYGYDGSVPTRFKRRVTVELVSQTELRVASEVTWVARGGGTSRVDLEDRFFKWRSAP